MSKENSIGGGIVFNVGGYVVSVLTAFFITPIIIRTLGDTRYGAWSLVSELIGYYGLLDLGIRGAVTYYVAWYAARNKEEEIKETLSSAFWLLSAGGGLAFLVGVGLTICFPFIFNTAGLNLSEVQQSLLIMSSLIAISLPMNAFGGALIGKQRFDISSGVEVANRLLTAFLVYIMLKAGGGLVALALVHAVGRAMSWSFTLIACRKVLGGIFARPKWFKVERIRELAKYGFPNAISQVAYLIIGRIDLTVVGIFAGIDKIIYYAIASSLFLYAYSLCSSITYTFTPRFTHLQSANDSRSLSDLYFFGMRTTGMVMTGLVAGMLVFGKDFIRLWLGSSYVTGPWTSRSDVIMAILILANLPRMLQSISFQRLFAMARVRFLMWLNVCEAIANLSLSILLVRRYGPAGVALGTFFPLIVSQLLIMPFYCSRAFNITVLEILQKGMMIPIIIGLLSFGVNMICVKIVPPSTWLLFSFDVFVAITISGLFCLGFGLRVDERNKLFNQLKEIGPVINFR